MDKSVKAQAAFSKAIADAPLSLFAVSHIPRLSSGGVAWGQLEYAVDGTSDDVLSSFPDPLYFPLLKADDGYTVTQPCPQDMFQRVEWQKGAEFLHELVENSAKHHPKELALRVAGTCPSTAKNFYMARAQLSENLEGLGLDAGKMSMYDDNDLGNLFELDYCLFNAMANRLAERIALVLLQENERGAGGNGTSLLGNSDVIGVLVPRTTVLPFVGQIAIFKAGCVTMPLDPIQPSDILAFPIRDSATKIVLTVETFVRKVHPALLEELGGDVVFLDFLSGRRISASSVSAARVEGMELLSLLPSSSDPKPSSGSTALDADNLTDLHLLNSRLLHERAKNKTPMNFRPCKTRAGAIPEGPFDRLAMLIYTSGSTGKPKGCLVAHGSYVSYTLSNHTAMGYKTGRDVFGHFLSLAFDGSLDSMHPAWLNALPIVIFSEQQVRSGVDCVPLIQQEKVTAAEIVPTLLSMITADPDDDLPAPLLSKLSVIGEALSSQVAAKWSKDKRRHLRNAYGPTEAAIATVCCRVNFTDVVDERLNVRADAEVPIGFPTCGTTCAIMDGSQPVPYGTQGELCLAGCQVAKGYLNRPEKTAESFVYFKGEAANQCLGQDLSEKRWYRTGDLCKIDPITKIMYFYGRSDHQVKVNGQRIELGEVEAGLGRWVESEKLRFKEQPVAAKVDDQLVAYFVPADDADFRCIEPVAMPQETAMAAKKFLSDIVSRAAVPHLFVLVPFIPRGGTGKVNRKALFLPSGNVSALASAGKDSSRADSSVRIANNSPPLK